MGKTTKYILIALGAIVVLLILGKATGIIGKPQKTQIATEKATMRDINETVSAAGKIKAHVEVKISPEVSGEVVELPVHEGDVVKKGQLLCRIRPDILKSDYERSEAAYNTQKASVANAKQMLKQSEATFANIESIYNRDKILYDKKVLTAAEFDAAKSNYEGARAALEALKQNVIGSQFGLAQTAASVKESQANLDKTTIYSPVDGVISKLAIQKGERVLGTQQFAGTEVMTISDLGQLDVNVDVNENDINRIKLGDSAKIEVDAFLGKRFMGAVSEIGSAANVVGNTADQVTNFTVKVRIDAKSYVALLNRTAANPSPFRPGLTATVDIKTNHVNGLSVPIQSVTTRVEKKPAYKGDPEKQDNSSTDNTTAKPRATEQAKEYVFVYSTGKVKQVQVTTGIQDDNNIQVLSGLKEGEEVVAAPYTAISKTLKDKMDVEKVDKTKLFKTDDGNKGPNNN